MCGILPAKVEKSKDYTIDCEAVGDFVKIVTGRNDGKLSFANLEVNPVYKLDHIKEHHAIFKLWETYTSDELEPFLEWIGRTESLREAININGVSVFNIESKILDIEHTYDEIEALVQS